MARRLVIIDGDAAGMSAATQVRRMKTVAELDIVVFERSSRASYAACGPPYLVGRFVKSPDSLVARTPEQHRAKGIDVWTRHEVTSLPMPTAAWINTPPEEKDPISEPVARTPDLRPRVSRSPWQPPLIAARRAG
jgi:NADPH-dependent 2,4-dienoyl-CoA reductase/sulfur reductase-like enzyme